MAAIPARRRPASTPTMIDRVSAIRRRIQRLIYRARRWRRQAVSPNLRRCLVVLRAGDQSLHPAWLDARDQPRRLWDLHLSYFGPSDDPFPDRPADVTLSREPGPKLIGLADCFDNPSTRFPRPLESYDWIWLPDDDMLMDQHNIEPLSGWLPRMTSIWPSPHCTNDRTSGIRSRGDMAARCFGSRISSR